MRGGKLVVQSKDQGLWDLETWLWIPIYFLTGQCWIGYLSSLSLNFLIYLGFSNSAYFAIVKLPCNVNFGHEAGHEVLAH